MDDIVSKAREAFASYTGLGRKIIDEMIGEIEQYRRDETAQAKAIVLLRSKLALVIPLARDYAAANPVGSNAAYVSVAERALEDTEHFEQ